MSLATVAREAEISRLSVKSAKARGKSTIPSPAIDATEAELFQNINKLN